MAYTTYQDFVTDLLTVPGVTAATGSDEGSYFRYSFTLNGQVRYGALSLSLLTTVQALTILEGNVAELKTLQL